MSGSGNLGTNNNGAIRLGGNSAYTTNYYYDDVAINSVGFPGGPVPPPGGSGAALPVGQGPTADASPVLSDASISAQALPVMLTNQLASLRLGGQGVGATPSAATPQTAVDALFADLSNGLGDTLA